MGQFEVRLLPLEVIGVLASKAARTLGGAAPAQRCGRSWWLWAQARSACLSAGSIGTEMGHRRPGDARRIVLLFFCFCWLSRWRWARLWLNGVGSNAARACPSTRVRVRCGAMRELVECAISSASD